jgi:hypothetical protein
MQVGSETWAGMGGEGKKKVPKQNQPELRKGGKKGQLEFTTWVSPGTGRDEKGAPHQCTIHPHWCTGGCWFTLALPLDSAADEGSSNFLMGSERGAQRT